MKVIFGQGNPGRQYSRTRHNIGWQALDALHAQFGTGEWKKSSRASAEVAEAVINGEKLLLVKPQSFYNETGTVARALLDFYKLDAATDLLVIHDELALPFGTVRIREMGSDAGNNGIKSLNQHIGDAYARLRIGIWSELRDRLDDADFVLSRFSDTEQHTITQSIIPIVVTLAENFANGTLENTSVRHSLPLK